MYIYIYIYINKYAVQQDAHPRIPQPEPTPRILLGYQVLGLKAMMTWGSPTSAVREIIQTNGMAWQLSCRCPASEEAEPSSGLMNGAYESPGICWKTLHPSTSYARGSTSAGPSFWVFSRQRRRNWDGSALRRLAHARWYLKDLKARRKPEKMNHPQFSKYISP